MYASMGYGKPLKTLFVLQWCMPTEWEQLGLKCGLEVHQQLDTGKLFCRCPSILREEPPHFTVQRRLRAVASELGEYDPAALEAMHKNRTFTYEAYKDTTCLVELDEEPIQPLNENALNTALEAATLLHAHVVQEIIPMRKTVVDGSNTSGFQRTTLVAVGGFVELPHKRVGIQALALEEDAARPMEKKENETVYRLDRLGIPLIEIATEPVLTTPEEAKQAALKIGEALRITGKVKRGLGTIRQDLNVSIEGGTRIEIKGVQELELIDEYVRREVQRQKRLLELRGEMKKRGIEKRILEKTAHKIFTSQEKGPFENTTLKMAGEALKRGEVIGVIGLPHMKDLLGFEIQPGKRFGSELAGLVKAATGLKGILHSDEDLAKYGFTETETSGLRSALNAHEEDAFALVIGKPEHVARALEKIRHRCMHALEGVPPETRNALEDGNTEYSRPLPGAARMYPETDLAPVSITNEMLARVHKNLPKWAHERVALYKKWGLSEKLTHEMKLDNHARFFESLVKKGYNATTCAVLLLETLTQLRRENVNTECITNKMIEELLLAGKKAKVQRQAFHSILSAWAKNPFTTLEKIIEQGGSAKVDDKAVQETVQKVIERNSALVKEKGLGALSALMGEAMKELQGKASGKEVAELLKQALQETNRGTKSETQKSV